jgi:hypothetical protein
MKVSKQNSLIDRLRAEEKQNKKITLLQEPKYFSRITFSERQIFWLEELAEMWINVIALEKGREFDPVAKSEWIQVKDLPVFVSRHKEDNIWRSWIVYDDDVKRTALGEIPFWLDIDDEDNNLISALTITRFCVELLVNNPSWAGDIDRIKVGFSGKKGFHIYMKPVTLINVDEVKRDLFSQIRRRLGTPEPHGLTSSNTVIGRTTIDVYHEFIRVMGSLHSWKNENGEIIFRRTFEIDPREIDKITIEEILKKAMP